MKISDVLSSRPITVSCEVFPPKTDGALDSVLTTVRKIAKLSPDFISVTYGAGGGTSQNTLRIVSHIQQELHTTALAHLSCVSSTKEEIFSILQEMRQKKIENILALRGDIPAGTAFPSPGQYQYAYQLVEQIKAFGGFCIGAACYPEGHVESASKEEDLVHLKQKVDCGCDFLTTQLFFDNSVLYSFLYRALAKNIEVPILAGIMPAVNGKQIARMCALSGASLPSRFKAIVDKFGDDPRSMKQAGIAYATEQIIDLIANGIHAIHIYTMNKPDVAASILHNLSHIVGKSDWEHIKQ